jgi:hypothetical protein
MNATDKQKQQSSTSVFRGMKNGRGEVKANHKYNRIVAQTNHQGCSLHLLSFQRLPTPHGGSK